MAHTFTLEELSRETGVSARTIRAWIEAGLVDKSLGRSMYGNYTHRHIVQVRKQDRLRQKREEIKRQARGSRLVTHAPAIDDSGGENPEASDFAL